MAAMEEIISGGALWYCYILYFIFARIALALRFRLVSVSLLTRCRWGKTGRVLREFNVFEQLPTPAYPLSRPLSRLRERGGACLRAISRCNTHGSPQLESHLYKAQRTRQWSSTSSSPLKYHDQSRASACALASIAAFICFHMPDLSASGRYSVAALSVWSITSPGS